MNAPDFLESKDPGSLAQSLFDCRESDGNNSK